jgi:hypothetical protein
VKYTFSGPTDQVYPQYLDVATCSTLHAQPGQAYDLIQVGGLTVPDGEGGMVELALAMPPDDRWTKPAKPADKSKEIG